MLEEFYLTHILFILAAAVLTVPIFKRLGLGSVLGYLAAGAIIGPWGFGFIKQVEEIRYIAEFGVVFLLFIIGVELSFTRLMAMKRMVFGLGTAQLILTGSVLTGLTLLLDVPKETAIIIGFGLALSSTAFVLQLLTEKNELESIAGRTSLSILLLQDLAVVPLLTWVSFLARETALTESVEFAFLDIVLVITAVILVGRFILTPVLHLVAGSRNAEVFISMAVLVILGTAWLMEMVGLSMALGAFLAGLILADSHYRHQIVADIQPFRGILLGLFFMSVGMSIDFGFLVEKTALIIGLVVALLAVKTLLLWFVCRITGINNEISLHVSMLLSQSGEFGLVLFGLAAATGLISVELFQILTLIIAISMIATPLMAIAGERTENLLRRKKIQDSDGITKPAGEHFIILVGFGRVGKRVAKILDAGGISYLALDNNPDLVAEERAAGFSVVYGDACRYDILSSMGATAARAIVVTIDKAIISEQLVHIMRQHYPKTPICVRGYNKKHCERLHKAGATILVSETLEVSLKLGGAALAVSGVSDKKTEFILEDFREVYYGDLCLI